MRKLFPALFAALLCATGSFALATPPAAFNASRFFQERDVKNFKGVAAGGPIDVVITLGNTESLRFEGDAEAIGTLVTEVKSGILVIRPQNSWGSWAKKYENKKITAYVTAKQVSSLIMSGNGSISVSGVITGPELTVTLSGSGQIKASVNVDNIVSVISGSGNVDLNGKGSDASVTLSGSGNLNGKTLTIDDLSTQISGSGSVYVKVNSKIEATIVGSGRVLYSGDPTIKKTVIGSGGLSKM